MRHVDEGTLHAFLDGELSPAEIAELERHLSVCVPCRALLAEARAFVSESDKLVVALDVAMPSKAPRGLPRPGRTWRPRLSTLAWAATVVFAVGVGYQLRTPATVAPVVTDEVAPRQDAKLADAPAIAAAPQPAASSPAVRLAPPETEQASALASAGQGGVATQSIGRANDVAGAQERSGPPAPIAAAAPAEPAATRSTIALVDGAPVDTTSRPLSFGLVTTTPPKRITLDEAVTHLGGTIRLIDGLAPQRVELLAGVDVAGADPDRTVVRVYYEEPDLGLVTLDQQRPGPSFASAEDRARRAEAQPAAVTVNPPMTSSAGRLVARAPIATSTIAWRSDGVWLALTSRLPGARMSELQARVK